MTLPVVRGGMFVQSIKFIEAHIMAIKKKFPFTDKNTPTPLTNWLR
jgi:hypothetical protein